MTSLELYRALVPGHAAVIDGTVSVHLELAAKRHRASAFGSVYAEAMVYWAAHSIQRTPGLVSGGGGADEVGNITSQSDGDLSRSYGAAGGTGTVSGSDADYLTTRYGARYLDLRNSRSAVAPGIVAAGC